MLVLMIALLCDAAPESGKEQSKKWVNFHHLGFSNAHLPTHTSRSRDMGISITYSLHRSASVVISAMLARRE